MMTASPQATDAFVAKTLFRETSSKVQLLSIYVSDCILNEYSAPNKQSS